MADLVARPLEAVRRLFQQTGGNQAGDWGVRTAFEAALADPAVLAQVPYLNADTIDSIPQGGLVRYRGMVQDTLDPEYYLGAHRLPDGTWATTKFSDAALAAPPPSEGDIKVWDRKPMYCTAAAGEAGWVAALNPGEQDTAAIRPSTPPPGEPAHTSKRTREEPDSEAEDMAVEAPLGSLAGFSGPTGEPACGVSAAARLPEGAGGAAAAAARKQARQQEAEAAADGMAEAGEAEDAAQGAVPPPQQGDCIVFVYDEENDTLKLNEVVEFVGVLSRTPELGVAPSYGCGGGGGNDFGQMSELYADEAAARPPTSQVPRVHAILAKRQASALPAAAAAAAAALQPTQVPELRAAAVRLLTAPLGGDTLAAEYLLLQLLSRVHTRKEEALGVVALNITGCPEALPASASASISATGVPARPDSAAGPPPPLSSFGEAVAAAVSALAARVTALPLSVPLLNARSLRPRRDYRTNRLVGGHLQLPPASQLLVDETTMAPGTLAPTGVANLQAIKRLIDDKQVDYDFEYYQLPQPADVAMTLLSTGRSMFKESIDVTVPLAPAAPFAEPAAVAAAVDAADLGPVRAYIAAAQAANLDIDEQAAAFVEAQLAQHMAADRAADVSTFHTWLTLARLLALSYGETGLTPQRWSAMRSMEARREARLRLVRA